MQEFGKDILPMNHQATQLVQAVAETLISKNGLGHVVTRAPEEKYHQKDDEWLVYVVNQDIQNAFVMPGVSAAQCIIHNLNEVQEERS
jgi:hypothetical protein